ncbi:MAG: hypothetical protein F4206_01550 [Gammaproteobacteria bacterium]|nr:hypothetical protein [Gammaproteobacteria bacterium]MYG65401.1 hypothetical protein [Gammaproteobacteria bacterium]
MKQPTGNPGTGIPQTVRGRTVFWCRRIAMVLMLVPLGAGAFGSIATPAARQIHLGDEVELHHAVRAAAGARVYLQHGRVVAGADRAHREPYCYFHVFRDPQVIDSGFMIHPDLFTVKGLTSRIEYSGALLPNVRYAMSSLSFQDYSAEYMMTTVRLESASQPRVRELKCGIFAVPFERSYLTLEEIRNVLGNIVTLKLSQQ